MTRTKSVPVEITFAEADITEARANAIRAARVILGRRVGAPPKSKALRLNPFRRKRRSPSSPPDAQRLSGRQPARRRLRRDQLLDAQAAQVHAALEHDVDGLVALDDAQRSAMNHITALEELQGNGDPPLRREPGSQGVFDGAVRLGARFCGHADPLTARHAPRILLVHRILAGRASPAVVDHFAHESHSGNNKGGARASVGSAAGRKVYSET